MNSKAAAWFAYLFGAQWILYLRLFVRSFFFRKEWKKRCCCCPTLPALSVFRVMAAGFHFVFFFIFFSTILGFRIDGFRVGKKNRVFFSSGRCRPRVQSPGKKGARLFFKEKDGNQDGQDNKSRSDQKKSEYEIPDPFHVILGTVKSRYRFYCITNWYAEAKGETVIHRPRKSPRGSSDSPSTRWSSTVGWKIPMDDAPFLGIRRPRSGHA